MVLRRQHLVLLEDIPLRWASVALFVFVVVVAAVEVGRALVLVRATMLFPISIVASANSWQLWDVTYILIPGDQIMHITRGVLIKFFVVSKDEHRHIDRA